MNDKLYDHCGIFGLTSYNGNITYEAIINGLKKLQHRGRESYGTSIVNEYIITNHNMGKVEYNEDENNYSNLGIGHVRYSTTGDKSLSHNFIQPYYFKKKIEFSIAHNGNIPDYLDIIKKYNLPKRENDSITLGDYIIHFIDKGYKIEDILKLLLIDIKGVYSLIILFNNVIYYVRDTIGIRPLFVCKHKTGYAISSETCGFSNIANDFIEVNAGQIGYISIKEHKIIKKSTKTDIYCLFEYIYFMNYKSHKDGTEIEKIRYDFGRLLGKNENNLSNNIVVCGSPNTGIPSGKGFAEILNLEYQQLILKKTDDRSFILPSDKCRRLSNESNLYLNEEAIKDKDICIVDDSLVRGNTIKVLIQKLKKKGAKDIYVRISSPRVVSQCYFGIDIPTKDELIAVKHSDEEIANIIGAKNIRYLDVNVIEKYLNKSLCLGCFTGNYPLLEW